MQNNNKEYPDAGINASPEVQDLIDDFKSLPKQVRDKKVLLYYILRSGTPPYKMSKKQSAYHNQPHGNEKCGNCKFTYQKVINGKYICSQIRGKIKLEAWCKLWEG